MACAKRDGLLMAYYHAQDAQARAVTAFMNGKTLAKRRSTLLKLAAAWRDVQAQKAALEAHCLEHGCQVHKL